MSECTIDGCNSGAIARGLCNKHYLRLRHTGTTDPGPKAHAHPLFRFFRKVERTETCWLWTGGKRPNGYGHMQIGGKGGPSVSAHRMSYEIEYGPIPDGLLVMHTCDVRHCVNPAHLRLGTAQDNMDDMWAKGRGRPAANRGEENPRSKLTEDKVRFIRAHPGMGHKEIADMWGLSPNAVRGVRIGRTWTHID